MKLVELFAGIGGFTKGFIDAGYKIEEHYFSEIDKHAIANYKYNFPYAKYIGSVVDIRPEDFRNIDILTGGFPCQPFSLAGKRLGFDDTRGTMFFEIQRILMVAKPKCVVLENVKGLLNHDSGRTFATIYRVLTEIGYTVECQLLNTKWFLPQNRERIYIIAHLAGRSKPGVFPITENNCGINERTIETTISRTLTAGGNSGGLHSSMTLIQSFGRNEKQKLTIKENPDVANCLTANSAKYPNGNILQINQNKESGGVQPFQQNRVYSDQGILPSLTCDERHSTVFLSEPTHKHGENRYYTDTAPTIQSRYGTGGDNVPYVNNTRRLTEIECERLQGFPDNWTEYGVYEKQVWINKKEKTFKIVENIQKIPKTQRYKMLGNAVTVRVVEEIAKRITLI